MAPQEIVFPSFDDGLTDSDFMRLSRFIEREVGILMPMEKKSLLTARLQKRLRLLQMSSFSDYVDWVLSPAKSGDELVNFLDLVTTNKTDFFREQAHFDYLTNTVFPELFSRKGAGVQTPLNIWSAPCSTGEEPYTMAIVAWEFAKARQLTRLNCHILATDLSTKALRKGKSAVYESDRVALVPMEIKKAYMLRSKDRKKNLVKMGKMLRDLVTFQHLNFMDTEYRIAKMYDVIFCRNCLIYFDNQTSEQIVTKLCQNLEPRGYFFVGHSETLNRLDVPLRQVAPTIYQKI